LGADNRPVHKIIKIKKKMLLKILGFNINNCIFYLFLKLKKMQLFMLNPNKMESSYFLEKILKIISGNNEYVINFLKEKGLIKNTMTCRTCNNSMTWIKYSGTKDGFRWKCMSRACEKNRTTISIRTESPFDDVRSDLRLIVFSIYLWSIEIQENKACEFTGLSKSTMIMIYAFLRNICRKYLDNNPMMLGGEGIVCQVDESVFSYKPK
jgi:hypothetical protein